MALPDLVDSPNGTPLELPSPPSSQLPPPPPHVVHDVVSASPPSAQAFPNPNGPQPQAKATFSVTYPPGQMPSMTAAGQHGAGQPSSTHRAGSGDEVRVPFKSKEAYLTDLAHCADAGQYKIVIRRLKPAVYQGHRLALAPIEELDLLPYDSLVEMVRELHGGGDYMIQIRNSDRAIIEHFTVNIDLVQTPPKLPMTARMADGGMGQANVPGQYPGQYSSGVPGLTSPSFGNSGMPGMPRVENEEILKLRMEEQREMQLEQTLKASARRVVAEKAHLKVLGNEEEGSKKMQELELLREEMRNMRQDFKEAVLALANKKDDSMLPVLLQNMKEAAVENGKNKDTTLALIMNSMQKSSEQMMAMMSASKQDQQSMMTLLTTAMAPKPNSELAEMLKISTAANDKVVQMAVQNVSKSSGFGDKMLEALMNNKLNSGEIQIKQMMDMMDRGREQTLDILRLQAELNPGAGQAEGVINPEGGFLGNFGNILLNGLSRVFSGVGGGLGGKLGNLAGMALPGGQQQQQLMLPSQPAMLPAPQGVMVPAEEYDSGQQQIQQPVQQQQYVPVQQPQQQQYVPVQPVQQQPPQQVQQVQQQPPQQVQQQVQMDQVRAVYADAVLEDGGGSSVQAASAPMAQAAASGANPAVAMPVQVQIDPDLSEHVTEAMRMAIADINAGRSNQDWADYAGGKWGNFLATLVAAPGDAERLAMIRTQCTPAVYQQLYSLLSTNGAGMRNFLESLRAMLAEYNQERVAVA